LDGLSVHLLPPDSALSLLGRGHSIGNYLGATAQLVESDGYGPLLAWTLVMGGCDLLRITNSEHFFSWSSSFFHHQVLFWPFRDSSIRSRRPWYGFDAAFVDRMYREGRTHVLLLLKGRSVMTHHHQCHRARRL
jgi:hypothetical protein